MSLTCVLSCRVSPVMRSLFKGWFYHRIQVSSIGGLDRVGVSNGREPIGAGGLVASLEDVTIP
jgi:hypothetical protein